MSAGDVVDLNAEREKRRGPPGPGFRPAVQYEEGEPFDVHGFEQGLLWGRLEGKPPTWTGTYRVKNLSVLRKIAAFHGYEMKVESTADSMWCYLDFVRVETQPKP